MIGNLGSDAELKHTTSGKTVVNFSIAARGRSKNDEPTWVRAAMWGERATKVAQYLTKGSRVAVSGTLSTREYNDKTYVELDVQELELLGDTRREQPPADARTGRARTPESYGAAPQRYGGDDDIPF